MPKRSLPLAAFLAAALVIPLAAPLSPADAAGPCEAEVKQALQDQGVATSDVQSITVKNRARGAKSPTNYGRAAWVRLNSCSGHVVVNMTRYCMVQDLYTTGDCSLAGMPRY
ncbi:MAG: hypothetical protein Kow00114_36970 [Kiloniellaceae bacterium]